MVQSSLFFGISILALCHAARYKPCPLLGPDVLPPTNLLNDTLFQSAMRNLSSTLKNSFATGQTPYGDLNPGNNSCSVGIFDTSSTSLLSFQHSSQTLRNSTEGVKQVTENSIYGLGSGSKLLTAYTFFINAGPEYLERKVTDFVPELANAARNCSAQTNAIMCSDWSDITLGALLSHMAGIPRDYSAFGELLNILYSDLPFSELGLPELSASERPHCSLGEAPCTREEYLNGLTRHSDPVFAPFTTPVYSNAGYTIIGLVLEKITGKSMASLIQETLFDRVGASNTYYNPPNSTAGVALDGIEAQIGFATQFGLEAAAGGIFSTQHDQALVGQSILASGILKPVVTRQWLKPVTHTSSLTFSVGMPWEIERVPRSNGGALDVYTKEGNIPGYSSLFALTPDYNTGFVVLCSGPDNVNDVERVGDVVAATLFPALENTAKAQSMAKLGGTYAAGNGSNLTLTTQPNGPGLVLESWYNNDVDMFELLSQSFLGIDVRLYPSNLVEHYGNSTEKISFRAVFEDPATTIPDGGVFSPDCQTWFPDFYLYGFKALDEFIFELDGKTGQAISINPTALLNTPLKRML